MASKGAWLAALPLVAASAFLAKDAAATAIANSSIAFGNLAITPASGFVQLPEPWTLQAFAQANNSLGENDSDFDPVFSPGAAGAAASVTWAMAAATASAPGDPPDLNVNGSANSSVNIPGCDPAAAFSRSRGTLSNFFTLAGGTGSVDVAFAVDVAGALEAMTDSCGRAMTDTIFTLEIDGGPVLFHQRQLVVGPNSSLMLPFSERLMDSVVLEFGVEYRLQLDVDSESAARTIPEPPAGALLLFGIGALVLRRNKQ
ncbi:MAG: PEP-CTERM sorting domain-containing protein [Pseudomonadota bacterium]|nr:PEP-CTERM sorting domain-containing protein [Pseudomonadota bacterium]